MAAFLGEAVAKLILDASGFNRELARTAGNLDKFRGRADAISDGLRVIGTGFVSAGVGIAAGLGAAIKQAADFQSVMQNVAAISPEVAADMDKMAEGVLRIATETARMPTDLAEGLYDIISAAVPAGQALDVLESSAKAANAGLTTTATAAKLTVAILNSGIKDLEGNTLSLAKAQDISFQAVNKGVFTYEELASQIGDVLPLAAALGVSYEEVAAASATMTQNGVSLAETTTQLNAIFTAFLKPTDDVTKMFNEMGYETGQALLEQEGFTRALELVNKHLEETGDNTSDFSKNIRAIRGFLGLTNDEMVRYNENLKEMENSTGATDRALAAQSKTLSFALRELKANLAVLAVGVGTAFLPVITALTKAITGLVKLINEIPAPIKTVLAVFAAIASAGLIMAGGLALAGAAIFRIGLAMKYLEAASLSITGPLTALMLPFRGIGALLPRLAQGLFFILNPMNMIRGAAAALTSVLGLLGRVFMSALLLPVKLLISPFVRLFELIRVTGIGLVLMRARFISLGAVMRGVFGLFAALFPVISAIGVAVLRLIPAFALAFAAIAAWKYLEEPIMSVYNAIKKLLGLGDDVKEFFDFSEDTKRVDENSEAIRKNTKTLRDRIAEALGVQTKQEGTPFVGPMQGGPGSGVEAKRAEDVDFLKRLDRALKVSGKEIRSWSNKMKIGGRAIGDFFDIANGKGGKDELKTFRARLNDIFGPEVGGQIYEATKNLRAGIDRFKTALGDLFGSGGALDVKAGFLSLLEGANRFSAWLRGEGVQALGGFLTKLIDLAASLANIAASILSGDFGQAFSQIGDLIQQFIDDFVIPDIQLRLNLIQIAVGAVEWIGEQIGDLASSLWTWLFGGTATVRSVDAFDFGSESTVKIPGHLVPLITVAIPQFISEMVGDLASALSRWLFGGTEDVRSVDAFNFGQTTGQIKVPGLLTPLIELGPPAFKSLVALLPELIKWAAPIIADIAGKTVGTITGLAVEVGSWIVKGAGGLFSGAVDLFVQIGQFVATAIAAVPAGQIWGTISTLAIGVGQWAIGGAAGLLGGGVGLLFGVSDFVAKAIASIPAGQIWGTIQQLTIGVGEFALKAAGGIFGGAVGLGTAVSTFVTNAIASIPAGQIWGTISELTVGVGKFLIEEATPVLDDIASATVTVTEATANVASWAYGESVAVGPTIADGIVDKTVGLSDVVVNVISWSASGVATAALGLWHAISGAVAATPDVFSGLGKAISDAMPNVDWGKAFSPENMFNAGTAFGAAIHDVIAKGADIPAKINAAFATVVENLNPRDLLVSLGKALINLDFAGIFAGAIGTALDIASLPGKVQGKVTGAAVGVAAAITTSIGAFLTGVLVGAVTGEDMKWDEFTGALRKGIGDAISDIWSGGDPESSSVDTSAFNPFGKGGTQLITDIEVTDGLEDLVMPIVEGLQNLGSKVMELVGVIDFSLIKDGIEVALGDAVPDIPPWIDTFITELSNRIKSIRDKLGELLGLRNEENAKNAPQPTFPSQPNARGGQQNNASEFDPFTGQDLPVADPDPIEVTQDVNVALKFSLNGSDSGSVGDNFSDALGKFLRVDGKQEPAPVDVPIDPKFTMKEGTTPDLSTLFTTFKPTGDGTEASGDTGGIPVDITIAPTFKLAEGASIADAVNQLLSGGEEGGGTNAVAQAIGLGIANSIATGLTMGMVTVSGAVTAITQTIFTTLQGFLGTSTGLGTETGDNYAAGIGGQSGAVSAAATALTQAIFDVIQGFLGTATDIGTETGGNYADGVGSQSGAAGAAGGSLVDAAVAAMSGGYGAAYSAGQNVGAGLAAGIASMVGAVAAAAAALANASIVSTSTAYALHSPSKVFHKIGLMVGQGLANGIESTTRMVEKASESMVSTPTPNVPGSHRVVLDDGRARKLKDMRPHVDFHGATFVVPNLDTAAQIEAYFLSISR